MYFVMKRALIFLILGSGLIGSIYFFMSKNESKDSEEVIKQEVMNDSIQEVSLDTLFDASENKQ